MNVGAFLVGTLLILVGVILFLERLGYGWWRFSREILDYWPIALIIIGVSLFWGGRIPRPLALVIVALLVGAVVFLSLYFPSFNSFRRI